MDANLSYIICVNLLSQPKTSKTCCSCFENSSTIIRRRRKYHKQNVTYRKTETNKLDVLLCWIIQITKNLCKRNSWCIICNFPFCGVSKHVVNADTKISANFKNRRRKKDRKTCKLTFVSSLIYSLLIDKISNSSVQSYIITEAVGSDNTWR